MVDEPMDKSWMSANRMSDEYDDGVKAFLCFALQNARDPKLVSCPCAQCGNTKKADLAIIEAHLFRYGIDLTYQKWIWHGGGKTSLGSTHENSRPGKDDDGEDLIDMIRDAYDIYEDNPSEFQTLLDDAEKPLYVGCQKYSKLAATVRLYNLKATYAWSNTSFNSLLKLLRDILPEHNQLPVSVYEAKRSLLTLGMDYEKIHACPNDCILYRKDNKDLSSCPTCGLHPIIDL